MFGRCLVFFDNFRVLCDGQERIDVRVCARARACALFRIAATDLTGDGHRNMDSDLSCSP